MPEPLTNREILADISQRTAADRRRRADLIADARRNGYGPDSTSEEKAGLARMLHDDGCSYRQIGELFGVTGQTVLNWRRNADA